MSAGPRLPYPLAVLGVCLAVGLLLTTCDFLFHVRFGVLAYANPLPYGQAWWVYPNFVGAALGMYLGARWLFVRHVAGVSPAMLGFSLAWFVLAYAATGLFVDAPRALLVGLLAAWALRLVFVRERAVQLAWGLVLAVVGVLMEGAGFVAGTFSYRDPEIFHVPYWLAGLYLNGSFVVLQVVRGVEERYGRLGLPR